MFTWRDAEALPFDADSMASDSLNQPDEADTEKFISVQEFNIEDPLIKDILEKADRILHKYDEEEASV